MFGKLPLRNHDQVSAGAEAEEAALVRGPVEREDQLPGHGAPDPDPTAGGEGDTQRWASLQAGLAPAPPPRRLPRPRAVPSPPPGPSHHLIPSLSSGLGLPTPPLGRVPHRTPPHTPAVLVTAVLSHCCSNLTWLAILWPRRHAASPAPTTPPDPSRPSWKHSPHWPGGGFTKA